MIPFKSETQKVSGLYYKSYQKNPYFEDFPNRFDLSAIIIYLCGAGKGPLPFYG